MINMIDDCLFAAPRFAQCEHVMDKLMQRGEQMEWDIPAALECLLSLPWLHHFSFTFTMFHFLMIPVHTCRYLFHEWSGVFPTLPAHARQALAKAMKKHFAWPFFGNFGAKCLLPGFVAFGWSMSACCLGLRPQGWR